MAIASFGIVLVAEFGDLTQILTATLAARYGAPVAVGVGVLLALTITLSIALHSSTDVPVTRLFHMEDVGVPDDERQWANPA